VGTILGENQINITDMNVGRSKDGFGALMVITTQNAVSEETAQTLIDTDGVTECSIINLPD
jgi:L-serine deaminase